MLIRMKVHGIALDPITNVPIIILKDDEKKNTLPIWIGILEASAIAAELEKVRPARPMTHDLLGNILEKIGVRVSRIVVTDLRDNVYYAVMCMEEGAKQYEIDTRPSDAIAVALRTKSPIFVDDKVFGKSKTMFLKDQPSMDDGSESKNWQEILESLDMEDFGKYKM